MSVADYESALPELFPKQDDRDAGKEAVHGIKEAATKAPSKGFADIVEYITEGPEGRDSELIPFKKFYPKRRTINAKKAPTYKEYALVLRRVWVQQKHGSFPIRVELEIQSEILCAALRKMIVNYYENVDLQSFPIKISSPFCELFFYRDEIKALVNDESQSEDLRREMKLLHDFIQNHGLLSSIVNDYEKNIKEDRFMGDILWTIYPPNSLIVFKQGTIEECWICRNVSFMQTEVESYWNVVGFRVGFDGVRPGLIRQSFLMPISGMQLCKISELELMPIAHYKDWEKTRQLLLQRSSKLRVVLGGNLQGFRAQTYTGQAWLKDFARHTSAMPHVADRVQVTGRFIVDFSQYVSHNRKYCTLEEIKKKRKRIKAKLPRGHFHSESDSDFDSEEDALSDIEQRAGHLSVQQSTAEVESTKDDLLQLSRDVSEAFHISIEDFELLYPALIPAFWLGEKKWWWLRSDEIQDVEWNANAFEFLRLEKMTKNLVESLVKGHESGSVSFDDVIEGKGQGLIFLLHGEPGLGKTLTAESVADYLKRPLYSVTGGELSTDVYKVEERLDQIFELTKRWNAVSLLDEADVLLCKRNSAEMDRNAVVAVFLRKLEYFQGVLFLTTNRKEDFDDAFKSRIHVTITYPALSPEAQAAIWRNLINKNKLQTDDSWADVVFIELGRLNLNGRTIKNLLRTADAYSRAEGGKLSVRHVLAMVKTELSESGDDGDELTQSQREKKTQTQQALTALERIIKE
ncbi:hypothetical protein MKX08_007689 [Trichoderma sp. CBMAI-0020]|nr:hypothetical protein MKX08_007689 [Trichoderma sp. CBMAI-0020]